MEPKPKQEPKPESEQQQEQQQEQKLQTEEEEKEKLQSLELSGPVYDFYMEAVHSSFTQYNYTFAMKKFMRFLRIDRIEDLLQYPPSQVKLVEASIISWLTSLKKEGASFGTANCYLAAIKTFYEINYYTLNKRNLARHLPVKKKPFDDRGYTTDEIAKMLQGADERLRALILLLACTGMRIGALADNEKPLMQLKHLQKNQEYNLYKVTVYEGFKEEYFCFTTPEAASAIDAYLKYREIHGEKLTPESDLFREHFNPDDPDFDRENPRQIRLKGLSKLVAERAVRCGVMTKISLLEGQKQGKRRNKVFRTHGFRKRITSMMHEAHIDTLDIDKLLGHKSKSIISKSYYRPDEDYLLGEYIKAVDLLTINQENRLQRENEMLKVRRDEYEALKEDLENTKEKLKDNTNKANYFAAWLKERNKWQD